MEIEKEKMAWLVGLSVACPHGQETNECPVQHIRSKPLKERVKMVHDMAENHIEDHLRHHEKCSSARSLD